MCTGIIFVCLCKLIVCIDNNKACSVLPCKNPSRKFGVKCVVESGVDQSRLPQEISVIFPVDKFYIVHGRFGI